MKENNPNKKGLIYYGTDYKYIEDLDKNILSNPRHREEQFISISISGYESSSKCEYPDLQEFARVYTKELKIAKLNNGCLYYENGYINSMTCIEGFGPNPNLYYNSFFGLIENTRSKDLVTVVLSDKAEKYLVFPDKEREFEHMSLALHGFIGEINPEYIIGWIVANENIQNLKNKMVKGELKKRGIWSINEFQSFKFDIEHRARYGFNPSDVNMYLETIGANNLYSDTCKEHLNNILQDVSSNKINWNEQYNVLKIDIQDWWNENKEKVIWDKIKFKYKWL
jgi:hypothetical protein